MRADFRAPDEDAAITVPSRLGVAQLEGRASEWIRRSLDIAIAVSALVIGAPLLALTSDGAVLGVVGMHTRANKRAGACSHRAAEEELNGGLALPAEVITAIKAMEPN